MNSDIFSVSSDTDDGEDEQNVVDEDLKDAVLSSFQTEGKNVEVVFSFDTICLEVPFMSGFSVGL
jgi:hypothetical protein